MRSTRHLALTLLGLLVAAAATATQPMTLTHDGALYRVGSSEEGLVLTRTTPGGETESSVVPQSIGAMEESVAVGVDEATRTAYVVWQEEDRELSRIQLAWRIGGTWYGPTAIAGEDGNAALNPQFMVRRESAQVVDEGDPEGEPIDVETTILHVVWWSLAPNDDVGVAMYMGIPVAADGEPQIGSATPIQLGDMLPYGIGCHGIDDAAQLAHPKLFVDPASGSVYLFAADFSNCLLQIMELVYTVEDWDNMEKRGRHSIIFGRTQMIPINPDLPLGNASVKVGRDLNVVMYWDNGESVDYTLVDADGWSEIRSLALSETLNHEQAVELISTLTR